MQNFALQILNTYKLLIHAKKLKNKLKKTFIVTRFEENTLESVVNCLLK